MKRAFAISILLILSSFNVFAWQIGPDTLLQNLKGATDFIKANDAFYIVESEAHRVIKVDLFGNILETYGNRGSGNYQFDQPISIASSTGLKIYISDTGNNRIQVFDKRWQYLSSIKGNNHFQINTKIDPTHLTVNNLGEVIFYDRRSKSLAKYDEDGAFLDQIPLASQIKSVSGLQAVSDKIFVLDSKSGFVHRLSENGLYESFYKAENTESFLFRGSLFTVNNGKLISFEDGVLASNINNSKKLILQDKRIYILSRFELLTIDLKQ